MLVKTTIQEILESIIKQDVKIEDHSICGKCSKCGECCTPYLPISQSELNTIQKYVIDHKIRPQKQMLVMENRLSCPYYDGKKCLIYEVRPLICKEFYCNKKPTAYEGNKFRDEERFPVDMWAIAEDIDKYFRR